MTNTPNEKPCTDALLADLDGSEETCRAAMDQLAQSKCTDAIPYLARLSRDQARSTVLRRSAIYTMGRIGGAEVLAVLADSMLLPETELHLCIASAFTCFGPLAVPLLLIHLQAENVAERRCAADALHRIVRTKGAIPDENAASILLNALADSDSQVRHEMIGVVEMIGDTRAANALLQIFQGDNEQRNRERAIESLRRLVKRDIFPRTALHQVLIGHLQNPRWEMRRVVVKMLGEVGDPSVVPALAQSLTDDTYIDDVWDDDCLIAVTAVHALEKIGDETAVAALLGALDSPHENVRAHTAVTLASLGVDAAITKLIQLLKDETSYLVSSYEIVSTTVSRTTRGALVGFGVTALPALIKASQDDPDPTVRSSAVEVLGELASKARFNIEDSPRMVGRNQNNANDADFEALMPIMPALARALQDTEGMFETGQCPASEAVEAFKLILKPALRVILGTREVEPFRFPALERLQVLAAETLLAALTHPAALVRGLVAAMMGELRFADAVPALIPLLDNNASYRLSWDDIYERRVCQTAAIALEQIGTEEAQEAVARWEQTGQSRAYKSAILLDLAVSFLRDGTREQQQRAARAMAKSGDLRTIPALIEALVLTDLETSSAVKRAFRDLGEPCIEPLVACLSNTNGVIRHHAIDALWLINSNQALDRLVPILLTDPDWYMRAGAARVLDNIRDERCIGPLLTALSSDSITNVRQLAAYALGHQRDPRAADGLIRALHHDHDRFVSEAVIYALQQIGEGNDRAPLRREIQEKAFPCRVFRETP